MSPTETLSASSPSFLKGIIRIFPLSRSPNPLSGVTSTVFLSPTEESPNASSRPLITHDSPTETSFGWYFTFDSWMECFFASSSIVVSKTSPESFTLAV